MTSSPFKIELSAHDGAEILRLYYPNGGLGGLSIPGPAPAQVGESIHLVVRFSEPVVRHFDVKGHLSWIRHKGNQALPEAYGFDFSSADAAGRERLLAYANDRLPPEASRFDERITADLPVRLITQGRSRKESLCDISQGGAFVKTMSPVPPGTEVELELRPALLTSIRLKGKVTWLRSHREPRGVGVAFAFRNASEADKVRKLLEKLLRARQSR